MIRCVIELVEMHLHVDGPLAVMDKLNANWIARLLISLIRNNIAAAHWEIEIIVAFAFQSLIAVDGLSREKKKITPTTTTSVTHFLVHRFPVKCQRWISIQSTQFPLSLTFMDHYKSLG